MKNYTNVIGQSLLFKNIYFKGMYGASKENRQNFQFKIFQITSQQ